MDSLPSELIYEIASHLDGKSLINFCQTNRRHAKLTHDERFWRQKLIKDFPFVNHENILNLREAYIDYSCQNIKQVPIYSFSEIIDELQVNRRSSFEEIVDRLNINAEYYLTVFNRLKQRELHNPSMHWTQMICFNVKGKDCYRKGAKNRYKTYTISSDIDNPKLTFNQLLDSWWNSPNPTIVLSYHVEYLSRYTWELNYEIDTNIHIQKYARSIFSSVFKMVLFFILIFFFIVLLFVFPDFLRLVYQIFNILLQTYTG